MDNQTLAYNGKCLKKNNEWYTPKDPIIDLIERIVDIPKDKVIWCPFDEDTSWFPTILISRGYKVINSHINKGQDFYTYEPKEHWDIIISNPPFENKRLILERCMSFNKSFILLQGGSIGNTASTALSKDLNKCKVWFYEKPITFFNYEGEHTKFKCIWVMSKDIKIKEEAYE